MSESPAQPLQLYYEDFTEENYRRLVRLAKQRYTFISYPQHEQEGHNVLWRHDVDYSIARSLALAKIEVEEEVRSTFFVYPHCPFYNLLDVDTARQMREILKMGHSLGLHLDVGFMADYYGAYGDEAKALVNREKELMETLFDAPIHVVSFHQPELRGLMDTKQPTFQGMINVYADSIFNRYTYSSDSNGYWRFARMEDVLRDESLTDVQVLTHPAWWTPGVLTPAQRIMRTIKGRARSSWKRYSAELTESGRNNVGGAEYNDASWMDGE